MISNAQNENGTFSADVKLHLHIGDQRFELGQLGPGLAILRDAQAIDATEGCLLYTSPSPRDQRGSRMPSSA